MFHKEKQTEAQTEARPKMDNQSRNSYGTGALTSYSSQVSEARQQRKVAAEPSKAVSNGRILFLIGLVVIAASLAVGFYILLFHSETKLAEKQYESIVARAIETAKEIAERKRLGTLTMAISAAAANPNIEDWPFVTIDGFEEIATSLIHTSNGRELGFAPIVAPEQLQDFEDFAYDHFYETMGFPNTTAIKPFGRGVFGFDKDGAPYKETNGQTFYNSPNQILTPIIQHDMGVHPALLLNIHFAPSRGEIIDGIIECSKQRQDDPERVCAGISDMLILTSQEVEPGPGAIIIQPIYPKNNPTMVSSDSNDRLIENCCSDF